MKEIVVLRHGEAVSGLGVPTDVARPLTAEGERAARRVAEPLRAKLGLRLGCLAVSSAVRAQQTADALCEAVPQWVKVRHDDPALYLADCGQLWDLAWGLPEVRSLVLVGHNPGLSEWVQELTGRACTLQPAQAVHLRADVGAWSELAPGRAVWLGDFGTGAHR